MIGPRTELDGFVIEAVAGRGGMGIVYRARQTRPERIVALKVIATGLADDPQFAARFRRESSIAAQIEHPNVIPVHAVGEADGVLYIAMRFVVGTDLHTLLALERRLEPRRAAHIADQVAQALDAAHVHGLVHRDIKPENILISTAGGREHVYLSDFGISRHVEGSQALTDSGAFVGTVDYVSPEQARGGRVDARSDVYSLGCVLFEALTGTVPFPLDNDLAKLYAHDSKPPPSVLERSPDVPAAFEHVLARAMAKSADDRYPSAGDLGRAASAAASGESLPAAERRVAIGDAAPNAPAATTERSPTDATLVASARQVRTKATPNGRPQSSAETGPGAERRVLGASHRQRALAGALAIAVATAAGVMVALALGGQHQTGKTRAQVATLRVPGQYRSIQAALNAAKSGETVAVAAGRFPQQLTIRKRVTLTGAGIDSTTISAPSSLAPGPLASLHSIVTVVGGAHVTISNLKIAGPPTASCSSPSDLNTGVLVGENATLDLRSAAVTNIRDTPAGCVRSQTRAVAVAVGVSGTLAASLGNRKGGMPGGGYASPGHATIKAALISGYGQEGIDVAGSGSTATITSSHISGIGSSSAQVVHGILVQFGGTATIVRNTISGNQCTSRRAAASSRGGRPCGPAFYQVHDKGISVALAGPGTVIMDNKLSRNDVGIALVKAPTCCTISHNMLVGNRYFGDLIWDSGSASVNGDIISGGRVGVGVVAQKDNTAVALHSVSIRHTALAPTRTYPCCGHHATVVP
jgi:Protein kinase domain/Right handed beta helix region